MKSQASFLTMISITKASTGRFTTISRSSRRQWGRSLLTYAMMPPPRLFRSARWHLKPGTLNWTFGNDMSNWGSSGCHRVVHDTWRWMQTESWQRGCHGIRRSGIRGAGVGLNIHPHDIFTPGWIFHGEIFTPHPPPTPYEIITPQKFFA